MAPPGWVAVIARSCTSVNDGTATYLLSQCTLKSRQWSWQIATWQGVLHMGVTGALASLKASSAPAGQKVYKFRGFQRADVPSMSEVRRSDLQVQRVPPTAINCRKLP